MAFFGAYGDIVGGIGSYPAPGNPQYHQASDLLEMINHQLTLHDVKPETLAERQGGQRPCVGGMGLVASHDHPTRDRKIRDRKIFE